MRFYTFILALFFLLSLNATSQTRILDGVYIKSDEERVAEIDKITQEIKAGLNSLSKTQNFKDSSNYRLIYKKAMEPLLISIHSEGKDISYVKDWYFQNGHLIFVEQITRVIEFDKVIDTERMYLDKENLFIWIQSGKKVDPSSSQFKEAAKELREYSNKLIVGSLK